MSTGTQIKLVKKYLKLKILEDNVTFRGHSQERFHVYDLIKRTITNGESHSALMIGPRGCGKTTLVESVVQQLSRELDVGSDAIMVRLNGLVHHDDKTALKAITAQMQLENAVGDRVFGTFAENLAFLLSCLQSGVDRRCKSMVFILEEADMFCHANKTQTLLYNLFDITHNESAPMCVLGITSRIDIMELLEKRVKSRFSHRHIFIFPNEDSGTGAFIAPHEAFKALFVELLSLPVARIESSKKKKIRRKSAIVDQMDIDQDQHSLPDHILAKCKVDPTIFDQLDPKLISTWNNHIKELVEKDQVVDAIEKYCYYIVNEQCFRNVLFQQVCKLNEKHPTIEAKSLIQAIDNAVAPEHKVKQLKSLSVLEFSLVIAMLHGMEIFDGQPMNFEMVLHRYQKFATTNCSTQSVPRPVILKAFEHLQALELVTPAPGVGEGVQREYRMHQLAASAEQVRAARGTLPIELEHWLNNIDF